MDAHGTSFTFLWWLALLSIFSHVCWPLIYHTCRTVYLGSLYTFQSNVSVFAVFEFGDFDFVLVLIF